MYTQEPALFIILGGTGDLSKRKLLPALCQSAVDGLLDERTQIIGLDRSAMPDESFREIAREALKAAKFADTDAARFCERVHYQPVGEGTVEDYRALGQRLDAISRERDVPPNRAFYMSLPPGVFPGTVTGLGEAGLNRSDGWTRLVIEKPFGRDLESARGLNDLIHRYFSEKQVYRVDHYLGKDTVQNLLVFRLANGLIESAWNRERVDSVQITVAETLGVETRAGYYDTSGALRDMVQNHLSQLLTLAAMEVPTSFDADAIRHEKIKVLRTLAPIRPEHVIRGQYTAGTVAGETSRSYLEENGVAAGSDTETFVALKLFVDSWRWQGVPFYLRTGKRLPRKTTQIAVRFREAPVSFFSRMGCTQDTADVLLITLQPDEGFSFHFDIKAPGEPLQLRRIPLRFHYREMFDGVPEAYQTLLLDVLAGDQTLFVHGDEVEESWRAFTPVLENPPCVRPYAAGTWGPPEADAFAIPETDLWQGEGVIA
jgi:glucose-6-phosphate 1-dehydrogenase